MRSISPTVHITKFGDKFSVKIEWKEESYRLAKNLDEVFEILKAEFEEKNEGN